MVPLSSLVVPILLAAVLVFIASSIIHMVLGYHKADLKALPNDTAVQDALRPFNLAPGDYALPMAGSMAELKDPAFLEKMNRGPVIMMTVSAPGMPGMGKNLAQWFAYSILVSLFAAYVASRALGTGASYIDVFRFAGTTAFAGYSLGLLQQSIWWKKNWGATLRSVFDGLVYALLTAGALGWLWPR